MTIVIPDANQQFGMTHLVAGSLLHEGAARLAAEQTFLMARNQKGM